MTRSLCFLVLGLQISVLGAAPKTWGEWKLEGTNLANAGNYRAAAQSFRQALTAAAGSGLTVRQLVGLHNDLASAYADTGQYVDSEREWRQALALVEANEGRDSLDYALLLASMAVLPTQPTNPAEMVAIFRRAIAANARTGSHRDLALLRGCLAQVISNSKEYDEAEILLRESQSDLAQLKQPSPILVAYNLGALDVIEFKQGRFSKSVELGRESLHLLEGSLGSEHPSLILPLNNLATGLVETGSFEEAASLYQRAIAVCDKTLGGDHPTCGTLLQNYSLVIRKLGRKHEAKQMAERAKQIESDSQRRNGEGAVVAVTGMLTGKN